MENRPANIILEACVETLEQAILAQQRGADRIELCANLETGGLTPDRSLLAAVKTAIDLPIMAMVRPRSGHFVYEPSEVALMKQTIDWLGAAGVQGVVFGVLSDDRQIDLDTTSMLVAYAQPLEVTFHKAIDETPDPVKSCMRLLQIPGIQRILTSGGENTALAGQTILKEMIRLAGDGIKILAAGKVTFHNLAEVHRAIGAQEYHGRRIVY